MDLSVLAVLAAYQNNLVSTENDDVTSGSMSTTPMSENTTLAAKKLTFWCVLPPLRFLRAGLILANYIHMLS